MLPFFSFHYAACVLTTSFSVSCLGLFQSLVFFCIPSMCFHFSVPCIGEGNDNPLQCSCLENPRDGRAWWAAISGVAQSRTQLKRLSSSSSSSQYVLCPGSSWIPGYWLGPIISLVPSFLSVYPGQTQLSFLSVSFENEYLQSFSEAFCAEVHCVCGMWVSWGGGV